MEENTPIDATHLEENPAEATLITSENQKLDEKKY